MCCFLLNFLLDKIASVLYNFYVLLLVYSETYRSGHNESDSKSDVPLVPWVRIPPFPPLYFKSEHALFCIYKRNVRNCNNTLKNPVCNGRDFRLHNMENIKKRSAFKRSASTTFLQFWPSQSSRVLRRLLCHSSLFLEHTPIVIPFLTKQ